MPRRRSPGSAPRAWPTRRCCSLLQEDGRSKPSIWPPQASMHTHGSVCRRQSLGGRQRHSWGGRCRARSMHCRSCATTRRPRPRAGDRATSRLTRSFRAPACRPWWRGGARWAGSRATRTIPGMKACSSKHWWSKGTRAGKMARLRAPTRAAHWIHCPDERSRDASHAGPCGATASGRDRSGESTERDSARVPREGGTVRGLHAAAHRRRPVRSHRPRLPPGRGHLPAAVAARRPAALSGGGQGRLADAGERLRRPHPGRRGPVSGGREDPRPEAEDRGDPGHHGLLVQADPDALKQPRPKPRPISPMFVDSHCHLSFPELHGRIDDIREGVREPDETLLMQLAAQPGVVAIGETGLDYYRPNGRSHADMAWQRERFRVHIRAARDSGLPLVVHTRAAGDDTIALLREEGAGRVAGVLHCFTETRSVAEAALELGLYISFSGILTFKNADALREVARQVPLERCLIETDSPYLAPVPFRGQRNQPAYVRHVAAALAALKGCTIEQIATATSANYDRLFGPRVDGGGELRSEKSH